MNEFELIARLTGGSDPMVTVDGVRMARKKMFFSSAKAERALGYRHRPANAALATTPNATAVATTVAAMVKANPSLAAAVTTGHTS